VMMRAAICKECGMLSGDDYVCGTCVLVKRMTFLEESMERALSVMKKMVGGGDG